MGFKIPSQEADFKTPTSWPDLHIDFGGRVQYNKVDEDGTAFFFVKLVGVPQEAATYAAINSGFSQDKPLVIPQKCKYRVLVGIFSGQCQGYQPVAIQREAMRTEFYNRHSCINFVSIADGWKVTVTPLHGQPYEYFEESEDTPEPESISRRDTAQLEDLLLEFSEGLSRVELKTDIWSEIRNEGIEHPTVRKIPVHLELWVYGSKEASVTDSGRT